MGGNRSKAGNDKRFCRGRSNSSPASQTGVDSEYRPKPDVYFICCANANAGFGHLSRCRRLANAFHERRYRITFLLFNSSDVRIEKQYHPQYFATTTLSQETRIVQNVIQLENNICVIDRKRANYSYLKAIAAACLFSVDINGEYHGPNPCSLIVRGDIGFRSRGNMLGGARYKLLGADFRLGPPKSGTDVVISFGGSDPAHHSEWIASRLQCHPGYRYYLCLGPGFQDRSLPFNASLKILRHQINIGIVLSRACLALMSGGIALYEALCCAAPCLVLPQNRREYREARALEKRGLIKLTTRRRCLSDLRELLANESERAILRKRLDGLLDDRAAERILDEIERRLILSPIGTACRKKP